MPKPPRTAPNSLASIAPTLAPADRVLLFCLASGTPHGSVGITSATVGHMVVRGLVERGRGGRLALTEQGRAVLMAMIGA